jgi:hypothetical protein
MLAVLMNNDDLNRELANFSHAIQDATGPADSWKALQDLVGAVVGFKLYTVMIVDMVQQLASRAYSSHPTEYPVSGTKPIHYDAWFEIVLRQHKPFVANTISDIAKVFPDHEKIWSMGCGSVINLPVVIDGVLTATINMLHEEHYYTPPRVARAEANLSGPAKRAYLAARS